MKNWLRSLSSGGRAKEALSPIIIVGTGRCGTTLLFDLLKEHEDLIATTGYPDGEDHLGWVKYGGTIISGLGRADDLEQHGAVGYPYCLEMGEDHCNSTVAGKMHSYYTTLSKDTGMQILNKCPHLWNKLRYVLSIFPNARIIHVIRDCIPVVCSWIKIMDEQKRLVLCLPAGDNSCFSVYDVPEGVDRKVFFSKETRYYPGGGMQILPEFWNRVNSFIPKQMGGYESQLYTLRYEDLVLSPCEEMRKLCQFCGIDCMDGFDTIVQPGRNDGHKGVLPEHLELEFLEMTHDTRVQYGYA